MKKIVLYMVLQIGVFVALAQHKAQLIVHAPVLAPNDTLQLFLQADRIGLANRTVYRKIKSIHQKGEYQFVIDSIDRHIWAGMNLTFQKRGNNPYLNILDEFLLTEGDSIHIHLIPKKGLIHADEEGYDGFIPMLKENWVATFTGRGALRFELQWKINVLSESNRKNQILNTINVPYPTNHFLVLDRLEEEALALLGQYQDKLTSYTYEILRKQILGQFGYAIGRQLEVGYFFHKREGDAAKGFQTELAKFLARGEKDLEQVGDDAVRAPKYMDYLSKYMRVAFYAQKTENWDVDLYYDFTKMKMKPSLVSDRILARLMSERFMHKPQKELLDDALARIKDSYSWNHVVQLKNLLKDNTAYDFSLPDVNGKYHKADDFKGKVVFMDFWYAACGPCKAYMKNVVSPVKEHFKDNPNVVFITVSTDSYQTFAGMVNRIDFLPESGIHLYTDSQNFKHPIIRHYNIRAYPYPLLIGRSGQLLAMGLELMGVEDLKNQINAALIN